MRSESIFEEARPAEKPVTAWDKVCLVWALILQTTLIILCTAALIETTLESRNNYYSLSAFCEFLLDEKLCVLVLLIAVGAVGISVRRSVGWIAALGAFYTLALGICYFLIKSPGAGPSLPQLAVVLIALSGILAMHSRRVRLFYGADIGFRAKLLHNLPALFIGALVLASFLFIGPVVT